MFSYIFQGFMLGIAYVAPIGMQNTYVINTAAQSSRSRALQVALVTAFFDIALAFACFFGVGLLLDTFGALKMLVLGLGSLAVVYIGISLMRSVPKDIETENLDKPLSQIVLMVFAVTWLNPQALIDGSLLLGGFKASLDQQASSLFILGVSMASASWFIGISMLVNLFRDKMTAKTLRVVNLVCGSTIVLFGIKLAITFVRTYVIG